MKKLVLVLAAAALICGGLSSCKKCSTCKATKAGESDYSGLETCGNSTVINDYEKAFKAVWEADGYTVTCN